MKEIPEQINTNLVWHHKSDEPKIRNKRILAFSPLYGKDDQFRVRLIDSHFLKICKEVEWWAYVEEPKINQ
jgi:hypothetical protein